MRARIDELGADTAVALILFSPESAVEDYAARHEVPFPLLVDADRRAYRSYGLGRGSWRRVWGLRAARRYLEVFRRDGFRELRRPTEDTLQLGGDFVIDAEGRLAWGHWGGGPDDRPPVDELIAAVRRCGR